MNQADDKAPAQAETAAETVETGPAVVRRFARSLPKRPGVYRMLDAEGGVLYVGKARSLKARVASYTRFGGHTNRIAAMIARTASMEFITTGTEAEALLLEANLIKRLKPHYNVILRDDKSLPYILLARDHQVAQIVKHRGAQSRAGDYYGPFASAGAVNRTINTLQKAFLLRSCADSVYENRTRPCLLYQIKRCSAPCTGEISVDDYQKLIAGASAFLSGKSKTVKAELVKAMEDAADKLDFEHAALYRDRISALSQVTAHQGINPQHVAEADVFAIHEESGQFSVQVFFFRAGQNWGNRGFFPRADKSFEAGDVLASFIAQFYDDKPVPGLILLERDIPERTLMAEALTTRTGHKVEIAVPQRGEKRALATHALDNAREALGRKLAEASSHSRLMQGIARAFGLEAPPRRIEVYDNSHIQGANAVGAMIVAGPEGFMKGQYRKFNIKAAPDSAGGTGGTGGDDYAMMREVLTRRFSRLLREHGDQRDDDEAETAMWPDLVLIDGGAGQLKVAQEVFSELGVDDVAVAGIAKGPDRDAGREHFHLPGKSSFMLDSRDPVLYHVQRLRDEAHRFAIGTHRARRAKTIGANPLDEIEGIGANRKRALLKAFGSARGVARASAGDLAAVTGISSALATKIYRHFHETRE